MHWLRSLRRTMRLVAMRTPPAISLVQKRRPLSCGADGDKPGPRASRFALAAASVGVALLAADHLYNGVDQCFAPVYLYKFLQRCSPYTQWQFKFIVSLI